MNRNFLMAAATMATLAIGGHAQAAVIDYTLQGVTFNDGATATGTVIFDVGTSLVSSLDITVTGAGPFQAAHYGGGGDFVGSTYPFDGKDFAAFDADGPNPSRFLLMEFSESLGIAETHVIVPFESHECFNCNLSRYITAGCLVLTHPPAVGGVPEPATWGLMILGFGLTGAALSRAYSAATA